MMFYFVTAFTNVLWNYYAVTIALNLHAFVDITWVTRIQFVYQLEMQEYIDILPDRDTLDSDIVLIQI